MGSNIKLRVGSTTEDTDEDVDCNCFIMHKYEVGWGGMIPILSSFESALEIVFHLKRNDLI